jgi:hypothetical protein
MAKPLSDVLQTPEGEWSTFPGGELQGERPRRLCPSCRKRPAQAVPKPGPLCFQCYRLELDREKALKAAGELHTASEARFQDILPLEPVDVQRLAVLKAERASARAATQSGAGRFADRRHRAQIAARHALQAIAAGLQRHQAPALIRERAFADAVHAAELQLPEAWLPFVVSR